MSGRSAEREGQFFLRHLRPGLRVLDVGCGPGTITLGFARAVAPGEVVGIDRELTMVRQAQQLAADHSIANAYFELGHAEDLPFPDASFDATFANTLLEHVPDPGRVVAEMRRVLKPDGLIGLRDGDWGSGLLYPANAAVEEMMAIYGRLWRQNGGNPEQGRWQRGLLRAAGFRDLLTSAGATILFAPAVVEGFARPQFIDRVVALGWAERPLLERNAAALREWAQDPDAFGATIAIETVGWKE
jgi:SAM-dependent methyltransferase